MGPRSSALVCGFTAEHRLLELEIARLKGTQDCLLFPTGGGGPRGGGGLGPQQVRG
jgi:7-keto-8-aminopelargonate synthetase-like enzyme